MASPPTIDCPVCGTAAEDITPGESFPGKVVRCPSCGDFCIANTVYEPGKLKALEPAKRRDVLARARQFAPTGRRPMITTYDIYELAS